MAGSLQCCERQLRPRIPIDLGLTLGPLRHGARDPSVRVSHGGLWRAARTPDGPVTMFVGPHRGDIVVRAWGPGAEWAMESAPSLVGLDDDPRALTPRHPAVAALAHRLAGLRLGRTGLVFETLLPVIVEQKVTAKEAHESWAALSRAWGEPAPGPPGLRLPPDPDLVAAQPYFRFHRFGIERRRAEFLIAACRQRVRCEAAVAASPDEASRVLQAVPGIGPWTAGHVQLYAMGDPDAVVVGDYHLPHMVSAALAGEQRGSDERMLELLEPYRGQRGRVLRLVAAGGRRAPNHHLRRPRRDIAHL